LTEYRFAFIESGNPDWK